MISCLNLQEVAGLNQEFILFEKQFSHHANGWWFDMGPHDDYASYFTKLRFNIDLPLFFVAQHDGKIEGVMVVALQELPQLGKAWYFCDLKISPDAHNLSILVGLVKELKGVCAPICDRAYALLMSEGRAKSRIMQFAMNCAGFQHGGELFVENVASWGDLTAIRQKYPTACLVSSDPPQIIEYGGRHMNLFHVMKSADGYCQHHKVLMCNAMPKDFLDHNLILTIGHESTPTTRSNCTIMHKGLEHATWDWLSTFDI